MPAVRSKPEMMGFLLWSGSKIDPYGTSNRGVVNQSVVHCTGTGTCAGTCNKTYFAERFFLIYVNA